jgi:hypothetical protein
VRSAVSSLSAVSSARGGGCSATPPPALLTGENVSWE